MVASGVGRASTHFASWPFSFALSEDGAPDGTPDLDNLMQANIGGRMTALN